MPAPTTAELERPVVFGPARIAGHTLTRAHRLMDEAERFARTDAPRAAVLTVRAMRAALVAVLIARGVHLLDGTDATLARTLQDLGLPRGAVRAFTDLAVDRRAWNDADDASAALPRGRFVIIAAAALVEGDRTA